MELDSEIFTQRISQLKQMNTYYYPVLGYKFDISARILLKTIFKKLVNGYER